MKIINGDISKLAPEIVKFIGEKVEAPDNTLVSVEFSTINKNIWVVNVNCGDEEIPNRNFVSVNLLNTTDKKTLVWSMEDGKVDGFECEEWKTNLTPNHDPEEIANIYEFANEVLFDLFVIGWATEKEQMAIIRECTTKDEEWTIELVIKSEDGKLRYIVIDKLPGDEYNRLLMIPEEGTGRQALIEEYIKKYLYQDESDYQDEDGRVSDKPAGIYEIFCSESAEFHACEG